jgi:hypothetical protein
MTCRELVEVVTEHMEGMLSPSDCARFETHVRGCRHCGTYLEQMRLVVHALGWLPPEAIPAEAAAALLKVFRAWKKEPRVGEFYALGRADHKVPAGSHIVQYYTSEEQRDEFARRYLAAGLAAGESCVVLGDPIFVESAADLLRGSAPAGGWSGRLFSAPWDRVPSEAAVRDFVDLHVRLAKRGPVGFLPEVPLTYAASAGAGVRFRGLGNFCHWSATELGGYWLLQICASVQATYRDAAGIIACMYELPDRPVGLRWGGLAVHSHLVNGSCIAQPSEALERHIQDGVADAEQVMRDLQSAVARGDAAEASRAIQQAQSAMVNIRESLTSLHLSAPAHGGKKPG